MKHLVFFFFGLWIVGASFAQTNSSKTIENAHIKPIRVLVFSPDSKRLLSASEDSTAAIWDVATAKRLAVFEQHERPIEAAAFSPDGATVVTGGQDKMIRLWEAQTGKEIRSFKGHESNIIQLGFADRGDQIVSGSTDKTIRVWDKTLGKELKHYKLDKKMSWRSVSFRPDGKFAILTDETRMRLMNLETGEKIRMYVPKEKTEEIDFVAFSSNGKKLVSVMDFQGGSLKIWDVSTALETNSLSFSHKGDPYYEDIMMAAFAPDGSKVLGISNNGHLTVWDLNNNQEIRSLYNGSESFKYSNGTVDFAIAISPDGRWAAVGNENSIKIWDVTDLTVPPVVTNQFELIPASPAPKQEDKIKPEPEAEKPITKVEKTEKAPVSQEKILFENKEVKVGEVINLKNVQFGQGSDDITPESLTELEKVIKLLNQYPNMIIELAGHTDGTGEVKSNLILSEQRVNAVRNYLVQNGIAKKRIKTVAYGGTKPLSANRDAESRRKNRRVEMKIIEL